MTRVDLDDRAPGGESRAFMAVVNVLVDALTPPCDPARLDEVAGRVCEALEALGQQQESPERARADMEEWQRQAEQIVAGVRARRAGQS